MPLPRAVAVLLAACVLLPLCPAAAPASTIAPLDLRTIAAQSSLVVVGRVRSVVDRSTKDQLLEYASVDVASVLQGRIEASRLIVRIRQGLVFFDRRLKRGDSGVFFLVPAENGTWDAAYPGSFALFEPGTTLDIPLRQNLETPPKH